MERSRLRKEAVAIHAIENPQEVKRLLQALFSGAAEASWRNHCQAILYGNVPEATASAMQACTELLAVKTIRSHRYSALTAVTSESMSSPARRFLSNAAD